ncbi:unnamed protein product [Miscanthus lutarioriparius]|uniref:adenylate kinase n=1 Tax=Miscanthus lutarioriparius TaxID=422564 RepID=A0A811R3B1_9POAL|nr:unnamed protein product [Miscanthus lutarioriparius]
MWRRRVGALLLRSQPASSSTAASSCQRLRHHLLPSEEPLALNRLARLFTSQAGSDGGDTQKPFIAFVLGGPGSGKGTQCTKIASDFGFAHLSAGDLLRHEIASGSEKGELILDIIKEGRIVPSDITVELIRKTMETKNAKRALIDGFPRCDENRIAFEKITQDFGIGIGYPQFRCLDGLGIEEWKGAPMPYSIRPACSAPPTIPSAPLCIHENLPHLKCFVCVAKKQESFPRRRRPSRSLPSPETLPSSSSLHPPSPSLMAANPAPPPSIDLPAPPRHGRRRGAQVHLAMASIDLHLSCASSSSRTSGGVCLHEPGK